MALGLVERGYRKRGWKI